MAQISFEYRIVTGRGNELADELGALSRSGGWQVAQMTAMDADLVVLLRREKDFEVAQSLQQALENAIEDPPARTEAIGHPFDPP